MADGNDAKQFPSGSLDPFDRIPVEINEMILGHLGIADLLSCGLVSKSWKNRSRSYLKSQRECYAYVENPCKDLLALNNQIPRSDLSMINGIHIRNEYPDKWEDIDVVDCCQGLMQFPLKYLHVDMCLYDETKSDVKLVQALVRVNRMTLSKLSARFSGAGTFFDFLKNDVICKGIAFPKLTVIQNLGNFPSTSKCQFLPAIAPRLQDIYGVVPIGPSDTFNESVVACFREVAMEVFTDLEEEGEGSTLADPLARTLVTNLSNLRVFRMECHEHPPEDYRPSLEFNLKILHNNCNTLKEVEICPFDLLQYVKDHPRVRFPKLEALYLTEHLQNEDVREGYAKHAIFQYMSTPEFFPSLKEIIVVMKGLMSEETEPFAEPVEEGSTVNPGPLVLQITSFVDEIDKIGVFGKLSQRITTLNVDVICLGMGDFFHLAEAFLLFPLLEELLFVVDDAAEHEDYVMDAFLCGIHVDEVEYLLNQHRSRALDLQQLNIVPVRPPITFTQNLTKLRLRYIDIRDDCQKLTEVSGYLAFGRMPRVEVTIEIDVRYRHECANLTRFANIVYVDEDDRMAFRLNLFDVA